MTDNKSFPFLMVPGLDGTARLFYRQIPELERRFQVVTFPLPDEGQSTMASLVEALHLKIQEVAPDGQVLLFGESFGGALSLSYTLAHAGRVKGLVILNSFPHIRKRFLLRLGPPLLKVTPWVAMNAARRFTRFKLHSPHAHRDDLAQFFEQTKAIGKEGYVRRLEILQTYDVRDRLTEIQAPTLFLAGDRDKLVPSVEEARFMAARMPHAAVEVLRGYGHICIIDRDFHLLDYVERWLPAAGLC